MNRLFVISIIASTFAMKGQITNYTKIGEFAANAGHEVKCIGENIYLSSADGLFVKNSINANWEQLALKGGECHKV